MKFYSKTKDKGQLVYRTPDWFRRQVKYDRSRSLSSREFRAFNRDQTMRKKP